MTGFKDFGYAVCSCCGDTAGARKKRVEMGAIDPTHIEHVVLKDSGVPCAFLGCEDFYAAPYCKSCLQKIIEELGDVNGLEVS